jgi:membrane protease YdiL (CAAX protease family)
LKEAYKNITQLVIAVFGVFITLFGIVMFNQYLLMNFPLAVRAVLMIVTQWLLLIVPVTFMLKSGETFRDIGFTKEKIPSQILIGIVLSAIMSLLLTVIPILLGFKELIGSTSYTKAWQFAYEFVYRILGIALVEEIIFRGYIFKKLMDIRDSKWFAIIVSSVLFGFFHIFSGNIIQIVVTAFIGFLLCLFREKIKNCSLLSLIIAHGFYDALIILWVSIL